MFCRSIYKTGADTYSLYESEVPDSLFERFSLSFIEYTGYADLDNVVMTLPELLQQGDSNHLCLLHKLSDWEYNLTIIGCTEHIWNNIKNNTPVCNGSIDELARILERIPGPQIKEELLPY